MAHYLDELNDIQRAAVTTTEGPILVIAGPGSGKTRVLTYRIAHLLEKGVPPWEILALTFTNKAAKEMKERIEKVVGQRAQQVWAGTFHSIFARILRAEASKIGFPSSFSVYDTDDTMSVLRSIIREKDLDPNAYNASVIRSRISLAKSNLISPLGYREKADMMEEDRAARRPFVVDIYQEYVSRLQRAGAMDFDDLLFQLYRLFRENPEGVVEKYQKRFKYLHVDEFQDTNFLQYAILRRLLKYEGSPENVFAVGDDAQSIYAFRGATIDNILDFEKDYPALKTFKLEQNYRSTHHIVQAANAVISHNRRQLQKTIWTDKTERSKIKLIKCVTDDEESRRVADLILEQKNRFHLPNSEFAILYRTNAQSRKFEEHLRRLNLDYRIYGGLSFYQRKEVKDFIAYLRLTVNPNDEEALRRIINYPTRGISDATVEKIGRSASANGITLWQAINDPRLDITERARKALFTFKSIIEDWQKRANAETAAKLAAEILRRSGLYELLKQDSTQEGLSRLQNVEAVLDAISEFTDQGDPNADLAPDDRSLGAYLQTVSLLTDADEQKGERDQITLMSVHAAKGLEYQSVFITGMEETLFPSFMSFEDPQGLDEERRLFYVAVTRAKRFLSISYAQNRYRFGQIRVCEPSRFLAEVGEDHYEMVGGSSGRLQQPALPQQPRAGISGNFSTGRRNPQPARPVVSGADAANFQAAAPDTIKTGDAVLHLKFGKGKVSSVEGPKDGKVATIRFEGDELPERRIVLKFAKLQVL